MVLLAQGATPGLGRAAEAEKDGMSLLQVSPLAIAKPDSHLPAVWVGPGRRRRGGFHGVVPLSLRRCPRRQDGCCPFRPNPVTLFLSVLGP